MLPFDTVIFDMDGVLIDAREWHFQALNEALELFGFSIDRYTHEERFNGLPTKIKLEILSNEFGLPRSLHGLINTVKQERTLRIAAANCYPRAQHLILISALKRGGINVGVATNSVRKTTEAMLTYAGILPLMDCVVTNQDIELAKPSPEIYLLAMERIGATPSRTLVVEDNANGIAAAKAAGCQVIEVAGPDEVHIERLIQYFPRGTLV
jgi:HAD superfamily hydrolase (TIGR01509 family)